MGGDRVAAVKGVGGSKRSGEGAVAGSRDREFSLVLPIDPLGKSRPRFTRSGICYTPKTTRSYEDSVAAYAKTAMGSEPLFQGPLLFSCSFELAPSARPMMLYPCKKPDIDNLIKAILDGLNGVIFKDDSQIIQVIAKKIYASDGEPKVCIAIKELKDELWMKHKATVVY